MFVTAKLFIGHILHIPCHCSFIFEMSDWWGSDEPPELSPKVIAKMSEDWWGSGEQSPEIRDWSDDDPPPELSQKIIGFIVQEYFGNIQDTSLVSTYKAPSQIKDLKEEHRGDRFTTNVDVVEGETPLASRENGRQTWQTEEPASVSGAGLKNPQAQGNILQLKELHQEQLTDLAEEDRDDGEMAVETGGSSAVGDDGPSETEDDAGQNCPKVTKAANEGTSCSG